MEHETKAARLLHADHLQALGHPALHLRGEFVIGELARGVRRRVFLLRHGHEELQMHVQPELEQRPGGLEHRRGQRLARAARTRARAGTV